MQEWQNRPLDAVYPVLLIDAIVLKIRDGQVANRPVYVAMGISVDGERDVLGLWVGPSGGEGDPSTANGSQTDYDDDAGDLPYEPPRKAPRAFDPGPPASLARLLMGGEPSTTCGLGGRPAAAPTGSPKWPTSEPSASRLRSARPGRGDTRRPCVPAAKSGMRSCRPALRHCSGDITYGRRRTEVPRRVIYGWETHGLVLEREDRLDAQHELGHRVAHTKTFGDLREAR
jgi:hypothetical protein